MISLSESKQIIDNTISKLRLLGANIIKSNGTFAIYNIGNIIYLLAVSETGDVATQQIFSNMYNYRSSTLTQNFAFIIGQKGIVKNNKIGIFTRNNVTKSISEITNHQYALISIDGFSYAMDESKLPICIAQDYNCTDIIHYRNGIIVGPVSKLQREKHTEIGQYSLGVKYIKMAGYSGYYVGYGDIASFEMVLPMYKLCDNEREFVHADREVQLYVMKRFMKKHLKRYNPNDYTIDKYGYITNINNI